MSVVLALDPSQTTGVCAGAAGGAPYLGLWDFSSIRDTGELLAALHGSVADAIVDFKPSRVIVEADIALHRRNPDATAYQQLAMIGVIEMVCWMHEVRCLIATASEARMKMLGRCKWPRKGECKTAVLAWAAEQGVKIENHNTADAFVMWRFGCAGGRARMPLFEKAAA